MKNLQIIFILALSILINAVTMAQEQPSIEAYLQSPDCPGGNEIGWEGDTSRVDAYPPGPEYLDSDFDGIPDNVELNSDCGSDIDGDGISNHLDTDSDGDGVNDRTDQCYCVPGTLSNGCDTVGQRFVFYTHGYGGNDNNWLDVSEDCQNIWDIQSRNVNYSGNSSSLADAAGKIKKDIKGDLYDPEPDESQLLSYGRNFMICHSLGGLVAREMGPLHGAEGHPLYDGTITVGTPHQGVIAANTALNNSEYLEDYLIYTCEKLGEGPAKDKILDTIENGLFVLGAFYLIDKENALQGVCNFTLPKAMEKLEDFMFTGIEPELTPEAVQNNLEPIKTSHNGMFYGIEHGNGFLPGEQGGRDGSLTPRFSGGLFKEVTEFPLYKAQAADTLGMWKHDSLLNEYIMRYEYWVEEEEETLERMNQWNWLFLRKFVKRAQNMQRAYIGGIDWFTTLDPTWQEMTGSLEKGVILEESTCECKERSGPTGSDYEIVPVPCEDIEYYEQDPNYWDCYMKDWVFDITLHPTDGFILAESAMNAENINYRIRLMEGSNHFQMRNDDNTRRAMEFIYDQGMREGNHGGTFFTTDRK